MPKIDDKQTVYDFLSSQRVVVIASSDKDVWISNVYYGIDEAFKLYFVSGTDAKHSQQIMKNKNVAFSVVWFDKNNHKNRKAVQGKGICRIAKSDAEVKKGIALHNKLFPEFAKRLTVDYIKNKKNGSEIWVIEPSFIKYWNDELYGDNGTKEFSF